MRVKVFDSVARLVDLAMPRPSLPPWAEVGGGLLAGGHPDWEDVEVVVVGDGFPYTLPHHAGLVTVPAGAHVRVWQEWPDA